MFLAIGIWFALVLLSKIINYIDPIMSLEKGEECLISERDVANQK